MTELILMPGTGQYPNVQYKCILYCKTLLFSFNIYYFVGNMGRIHVSGLNSESGSQEAYRSCRIQPGASYYNFRALSHDT